MSRIPIHTLESAPLAGRPVLEALARRSPTGQPINLHAQMAHAPAVLLGYMAMRQALDDHGTLDRKTRTAILLTTAAADECAYTVALNAMIAQQAGWDERETLALRTAGAADPKLASLLAVAGQSARNRGRVEEATWQSARVAGWTNAELAEAFGFVGLAQYVDSFINFAETEPDGVFADAAADAQSGDRAATSTTLTHLLIVEDQDRTRAFYEQVLGASVVRERDPVILHFHNSWIVANVGGPPTDDKPQVTMAPPSDPNSASSALNVRVADARATYEEWRARGGHSLTPPVEHGGELRCYLRDPDGHLIEVGEILPARPSPR